MPPINAARAAKARARLAQANSTLQHGEAATLTVLRGGVPVVGLENLPSTHITNKDQFAEGSLDLDAIDIVRRAVLPATIPNITQTMTVREVSASGRVTEYGQVALTAMDVLETAFRFELKIPGTDARGE